MSEKSLGRIAWETWCIANGFPDNLEERWLGHSRSVRVAWEQAATAVLNTYLEHNRVGPGESWDFLDREIERAVQPRLVRHIET